VALVTALVLVMLASPAQAQLYRWVNEQGEVHFTQGLENVPERFRGGARLLGYPEAAPALAPIAPVGPPAATPEAPPPGVRGGARIPFTPGEPILLTVRVNGLRTIRLLLDTGAQSTLIHTRALAAIGVDPSGGRPISVMGVTGQAEGRYWTKPRGRRRGGAARVIAYDLHSAEGDGLLGRTFSTASS
jgi:hypothetical protein